MATVIAITAYLIVVLSFGAMTLARSWRALAIMTAVAVGALILLLLNRQVFFPTGTPLGTLALLIVASPYALFLACISALWGAAARSVGLRRREKGSRAAAAPTVIGFVVLNVAFFGTFVALPAFVQRAPSEACLGATFKVEIGEHVLAVPAAPEVTIRRSIPGDYSIWPLDRHAVLRERCEATSDGLSSFSATSVTITIYEIDGFTRRERRYCESPTIPPWSRAICAREGLRPENWPHRVILAGAGDREIGFPLVWEHGPEAELASYLGNRNLNATISALGPFQLYQFGNIDFWVSDDPALVLPGGQRFVAECHAGCTVMFDAALGLRIAYEFYLHRYEVDQLGEDQTVERLTASRAAALQIVDSLVNPQPLNPP